MDGSLDNLGLVPSLPPPATPQPLEPLPLSLFDADIQCSLQHLFRLVMGPDAVFISAQHSRHKYWDVSIGDWARHPGTSDAKLPVERGVPPRGKSTRPLKLRPPQSSSLSCLVQITDRRARPLSLGAVLGDADAEGRVSRRICFTTPLNARMGPKQAECVEDYVLVARSPDAWHVQMAATTPNVSPVLKPADAQSRCWRSCWPSVTGNVPGDRACSCGRSCLTPGSLQLGTHAHTCAMHCHLCMVAV